jgi:hypothetical protein
MLHTLRTLPLSARTILMVLLVLGALLRSGLWLLGELHAAEHQVHAALADHDHTHDGNDVPESGVAEAAQDHTKGGHGLLHQSSGASFDVFFAMELGIPKLPSIRPSPPRPDDFASAHLVTPFRPPIA